MVFSGRWSWGSSCHDMQYERSNRLVSETAAAHPSANQILCHARSMFENEKKYINHRHDTSDAREHCLSHPVSGSTDLIGWKTETAAFSHPTRSNLDDAIDCKHTYINQTRRNQLPANNCPPRATSSLYKPSLLGVSLTKELATSSTVSE